MLGAGQVISLDIDPDALDIAQSNCEDFDVESTVDFVMCNLNQSASSLLKYLKERRVVDTVVMNPPFGTKMNKGELEILLLISEAFVTEDCLVQSAGGRSLLR